MIDLSTESVVSLTNATALLPRRRRGKRPNVATLFRWGAAGCKGVVLETIQVGGCRCTSREALQRFCDALTALRDGTVPAPPIVTTRAHQAAVRRAEKVLDAAGIR